MFKWLMIPLVIVAAAGAQIMMKHSINLLLAEKLPLIGILKTWPIYLSILFYVVAFAVTIYLFSVFELSFISPLMVGGVMLVIFATGMYWGESVSTIRISGGLLLVAGTALLAYSQ